MNNMRGAVMIAYPAYHGLPPYEGARVILEGKMDFNFHKHNDYDYFDKPEDSDMWFAGKNLFPEKFLFDYVGKNEKTKIILKL
jgi:hypothetical protein